MAIPFLCVAQLVDSSLAGPKQTKRMQWVPMPVVGASPTSGFLAGAALGLTFKAGKDAEKTSMSNFLANALLTARSQRIFQIRGTTFLKNDTWILPTDIRFNINSQPTYGLGTSPRTYERTLISNASTVSDNLLNGPPEREMMKFKHLRFYQTGLRSIAESRLFLGIGYHLDALWDIEDPQTETSSPFPKVSYHYKYQSEENLPLGAYAQSGLSFDAVFDSRDNIINAYAGRYLNFSLRYNQAFMGSTRTATQLWLEYRDYFRLSKQNSRHLIALWSYSWVVSSGKVPYLLLPATGWDLFGRSGRPHTLGRFRGNELNYTETEWRFPLPGFNNKFGGVAFVNSTTTSYRNQKIGLFQYFQFGYGAGLRYMVNAKTRANVSLDYGRGVNGASGLFLNINEMF